MSKTPAPSNFEYLNEPDIDAALKCVICMQPLHAPVLLSLCRHAFCQRCIETWFTRSRTCPTCRQTYSTGRFFPFIPLDDRTIVDQLDHLLVRCSRCKAVNIERGHWPDHQKICSQRTAARPWPKLLQTKNEPTVVQVVREALAREERCLREPAQSPSSVNGGILKQYFRQDRITLSSCVSHCLCNTCASVHCGYHSQT